ncbi:DUF664 domain-containing protein [Flavimobilis sp. GY10621]|uniref:DUF664 domain-containing protein n=1 Tax=Flavimobilis rhizosphaerae TaxID=2775421 RepID=A0ABR9DS80_9MICO|nr:DUF664 domain-containing protein [Flavimobilis rhizosphaerae]MBD9699977.1 DUF664 domain-containing protein [Flavimobilis rhizosphaerae]
MTSDDAFGRARARLDRVVDSLVWKTEGLTERELRTPMTPTGFTLLGALRHCANIELGYLGDCFGRPWPGEPSPVAVPLDAYDADPQADWWVPAAVPAATVVAFVRDVHAHVAPTLERGPDAPGTAPWWPAERSSTTLGLVLDHPVTDLLRHAGQMNVVRELVDGAVGLARDDAWNVPDDIDWPAYSARLRGIAEQF